MGDLDKKFPSIFNPQVKSVAEFILKKRNSYKMLASNLYNFVSGTTIPSAVTKKILNCCSHRKEHYETFPTEHFLDQSKKLFRHNTQNCFPKVSGCFEKIFNLKYTFQRIKCKGTRRSSKID